MGRPTWDVGVSWQLAQASWEGDGGPDEVVPELVGLMWVTSGRVEGVREDSMREDLPKPMNRHHVRQGRYRPKFD